MLVAWRRLDEVPADLSAARAWLFGVARKTLQNTRRRDDRHDAVAVRLVDADTVPPMPASTLTWSPTESTSPQPGRS